MKEKDGRIPISRGRKERRKIDFLCFFVTEPFVAWLPLEEDDEEDSPSLAVSSLSLSFGDCFMKRVDVE